MTLNETEEFARAIINTCASPGACDVVRIERATSSVTNRNVRLACSCDDRAGEGETPR